MNVYVIMINYCGEKDTIECVQSIKESHAAAYTHVIIVDNDSPDGSGMRLADYYAQDISVTVLQQKENWGFSEGNNIGARYAKQQGASHIIFLNNDTIVQPQFLDEVLPYYDAHPEIGLLTGKIYYYSHPDTFWYAGGEYFPRKGKATHTGAREKDVGQYDKIRGISFCCGCYMIMSVEHFDKMGEMSDAYFLYAEDIDYSLQAMRAGFKIIYHPATAIYHKVSASTQKVSAVSQYYMTRNSLLLVSRNTKTALKWIVYPYQIYWCMKRAIRNHYDIKNVICGWRDFIAGKVGKRE